MKHRKSLWFALFLGIAALLLTVAPALAQATPTDVHVWIAFTDHRLDWAKARAAEVNQQFPQYNVTVDGYSDYEPLFAAYALAHDNGNPPAVAQYFEVASQTARDSGNFKSIADALGDRTEVNGMPVNLDDFIDVAANYYTLDGKFNSLPWNTSTAILYVNQDIMKAAGVDAIPATWQDVEAACAKIMAMPSPPQGCINWPNHGWLFEQWMAQQNAPYANNDNGRTARATEVLLDSPPALAIATWWKEMYDKGYYLYTGIQRDFDGGDQLFSSGKVAMIISSSGDLGGITTSAKDSGMNFVTAKMPYNADTGWTGNLIGGASLWLTDGLSTDAEDGALTFMLYIDTTENAASWHQESGYIPIRKSAFQLLTDQGWFTENPNATTATNQLADSQSTVATRGALLGPFPQIRDIVTNGIEGMMLNHTDPAATLAQAKTDADKALADYNALYVGS
jgi:sn-glycerol 3-phosphate transport system substrate-binding protein